MSETVEKSCWGITLWAVAVVVGLILISSVLTGTKQTASLTTISTPNS